MKRQYNVTGMSCAACQARVEKAVNAVAGVESCSVNLLMNSLDVVGTATDAEIISAVEAAGYGISLGDTPDLEDKETPALKKRLIWSIGFLTVLMYLAMSHQLGYVQLVLAAIVIVINRKFYVSGAKSVMQRAPNMDTLVALGSGVSFLWSVYALVCGSEYLYFDSAAMILVLITVGKMLEAGSKGKTTNALKSLLEIAPNNAEGIEVGDEFQVKPGMKFPVDGIVVEGSTKVDESALTGESEWVLKTPGNTVSAATINMGNAVRCRAIRVGEDTTFSQIVKMVSETAASKAPIARLADKVSAVFVPVVIGIACVTFAVWMFIGVDIAVALERAISVMVISCPCALGLATPVAIMVGNGLGAKHGILFKTAEALEQAGKTDIVVLDKTGTITVGEVGSDTIRKESPAAIKELKEMGIRVVMLSGDKIERARQIAAEVGIDEVVAGVLPDGKDAVVKKLQESGRVAMVGEGINDAPALTASDVGIAIGAGTDVAIDSADIVLMNSNLKDVPASLRLSRATLRNIHENLFWAFFYNILCIPLAAGCYISILGWQLSPMVGAAAMSLSSFCVVSNALRLNLFKMYSNNKEDGSMTKTMVIEGMMCPHCEDRVKKALEAIDGVTAAEVSHTAGTAVVTMDAEISDAVLREAVEAQDYPVKEIK